MSGEPGGLLSWSQQRFGRSGLGTYAALLCGAVLSLAGLVGLVTEQPWLFPSLGPTLMVMAEQPLTPAARPVTVIVGHLVGVSAGWVALVVTGLAAAPPALETGLTPARVFAAVLSLALTALVLQLLDTPHPPAGATTLIVSLGLLTSGRELATIMASVVLVTILGTVLTTAAGARHDRQAAPSH